MGFKLLFFMWIFYINAYDRVSTTLFYGNVKVTWDEAHDICDKSGGKLADLSTVLETDSEQVRQEVISGRMIWINGFHNRTDFMWTYGCMDLANTAIPYTNFGRGISLLNCVDKCGFSDYVAMRMFNCYCVSPSDLAVADNPKCEVKCRGDNSNCGGTTQAFVYKRLMPGEVSFGDSDQDKNCVYLTKNSSENSISGDNNAMGNVIWRTEDCETELDGYVFQPHNVNPSVDVYKVYYSIRNWASSLTSSVWNGTLANIYNTTQRVETMRSNEKYWIGLYRADFTPDIEDRCDALVFGEMGEINDTIKDLCTERHTVLCEREDPTTPALLPSTFETTESETTPDPLTTTEETNTPMTNLDNGTTEVDISTSSNISGTPGADISDGNQGSPTTTPATTAFQTTKATTLKPTVETKGKLTSPSPDEATTAQDSTTNSSFAAGGTKDQRINVYTDDGKLHISAVILIIVLAVLLLLIFVLLIILLMRKRNRNKDFRVHQTQNTSYLNKGFSEEGNVLLVNKDQEQTPPPKPVRQKSATNGDVILNSTENVNLSIGSTNSLPKPQYSTFKPQENHYTPLPKAESLDIPFIDSSRDNLDRIVREPSKTDVHSNASLNVERPVSRENSPDVQKASSLGNIDLHIDAMFPNHDSVESLDDESSPMKVEDADSQKDKENRKNSDSSSSSSNKTDLTEMNTLDISYENGMGNFTGSPGSAENISM